MGLTRRRELAAPLSGGRRTTAHVMLSGVWSTETANVRGLGGCKWSVGAIRLRSRGILSPFSSPTLSQSLTKTNMYQRNWKRINKETDGYSVWTSKSRYFPPSPLPQTTNRDAWYAAIVLILLLAAFILAGTMDAQVFQAIH